LNSATDHGFWNCGTFTTIGTPTIIYSYEVVIKYRHINKLNFKKTNKI
jgi:hypothetical protein